MSDWQLLLCGFSLGGLTVLAAVKILAECALRAGLHWDGSPKRLDEEGRDG